MTPDSPDHIAAASRQTRETGARKYPAEPARQGGNVQDGISRGGTGTGDPKDHPPKGGDGLAEPLSETNEGTRRSDGKGRIA